MDLLEVGRILHMGCCGRKFGPGQLSTARCTRLKREKRGGFPPLLLNTMHFTPDIVANSRGGLKYSLNGVCPFHFSSQILSLAHSTCSNCLYCSLFKIYNVFIILSCHYSSSSLSSISKPQFSQYSSNSSSTYSSSQPNAMWV